MIALRMEFLAGRFHANPWDAGTNEGEVDWPPSPWRLLRAVVAGWYRSGAGDRSTFLRVLDALCEPPQFCLPRATAGHSRHYVPLGGFKSGKPEKTQILDSFLALEHDREHPAIAYAAWPNVDLSEDERAVLARACDLIGYLGRAESWCSVEVRDSVPDVHALTPVDLASRESVSSAGPIVRRLAPGPSLRGVGLLRSLVETTADMRRAKRLMPPGTAWVEYRLPLGFLLVQEQYEQQELRETVFKEIVLRFSVERPQEGVLPPVTRAVDVADLMRRSALSRYSRRDGPASTLLAGKADDGDGKRQGHDHPYYLPFDSRADGKIDRIDVWFPKGCPHQEYLAVSSIDALCDYRIFDETLPLTFLGSVTPDTSSLVWESITPVVLDRFPKLRGQGRSRVVDSPEEQIAAMVQRCSGADAEIEVWPPGAHVRRRGGNGARLDAFRARRRGKAERLPPLVGATLRFSEPVPGPIVLGRLAHFGLGQFAPCES